MRYFQPERIYVDEEALNDALTLRILAKFPSLPHQIIQNPEALIRESYAQENNFTTGKGKLLLMRKKGEHLKPFPLTPGYLHCHFQILHLGSGCDLECTYCILQAYLNNPLITVYTNLEEILAELNTVLENAPDQFFRVGTGELIDSLSLDHITEWSVALVEFFASKKNAMLELKTKSDNIGNLQKVSPKEKVIVSWSMNTETIQRSEEFKTATLEERITAAVQCQKWGYLTGFHFDPLIQHEDWETGYASTVEKIFKKVDAKRIPWISLGALRFMPELKKIAEERFPKTSLFGGEFIRGLDGKERYFKPLRRKMYETLFRLIRSYSAEVPIYLCMEGPELWEKGVQKKISDSSELRTYLDQSAQGACAVNL